MSQKEKYPKQKLWAFLIVVLLYIPTQSQEITHKGLSKNYQVNHAKTSPQTKNLINLQSNEKYLDKINNKVFVGRWDLLSWQNDSANGQLRHFSYPNGKVILKMYQNTEQKVFNISLKYLDGQYNNQPSLKIGLDNIQLYTDTLIQNKLAEVSEFTGIASDRTLQREIFLRIDMRDYFKYESGTITVDFRVLATNSYCYSTSDFENQSCLALHLKTDLIVDPDGTFSAYFYLVFASLLAFIKIYSSKKIFELCLNSNLRQRKLSLGSLGLVVLLDITISWNFVFPEYCMPHQLPGSYRLWLGIIGSLLPFWDILVLLKMQEFKGNENDNEEIDADDTQEQIQVNPTSYALANNGGGQRGANLAQNDNEQQEGNQENLENSSVNNNNNNNNNNNENACSLKKDSFCWVFIKSTLIFFLLVWFTNVGFNFDLIQLLLSCSLVPQIIDNVLCGGILPFDKSEYLIGFGAYGFLIFYFKSFDPNVCGLEPSRLYAVIFVLLMVGQIYLVQNQQIRGPRFFIPKFLNRYLPAQQTHIVRIRANNADDEEANLAESSRYTCAICLDDLSKNAVPDREINEEIQQIVAKIRPKPGDVLQTPCNHQYHIVCLLEWVNKKSSCPICRKSLKNIY